ncbi:IS66 family insertion sequence element accessory protein TnpB [Bradyrhizobium sp. URHA0013]|uniref:IS66 family insertion sequence element accessory protein TnpB n=1 Tax=Bradyrhizobium sp. URHA0013 TaxID=1380352 RepID=UPI0012DBF7CC
MIPVSSSARIWIATGYTDMRKGMQGLSLLVQESLGRDPFAGDVIMFRGRGGSLIEALWHDGSGLSLYAKRLDRGRFVWPATVGGVVGLCAAQMRYLLEAIEWRIRSTRGGRSPATAQGDSLECLLRCPMELSSYEAHRASNGARRHPWDPQFA